MNSLTYKHIKGDKINKNAISFCLYKSKKFDREKHIVPLLDFINKGGQTNYDILIFYDDETLLEEEIRNSTIIRLFKVTSEEKNYVCHLWRYLGSLEDYEWIWFRGTDSPKIPDRELTLQNIAQYSFSDVIIWSSTYSNCMGKFAINKRIKNDLINYLRNAATPFELIHDWHLDELLLSNWISKGTQKVVYVIDRPTHENQHKEKWIIDRLRFGNHVIIVKDRDDRNVINN